ncbi:ELWxxDGT repeat protein [Larkinella sp. VNQ87]|uniref:ELWxxDGT repeat protein n=1 Tax=Larkinella sp. VNQ87 TaxID=3400921 RepID=UPI003C0B5016
MKNRYSYLNYLFIVWNFALVTPSSGQYMPAPTPSYYVTRIKEINPTGNGLGAYSFIEFQNKVYFTGNDGVNGYELWATDGTAAGTVLVKNINLNGSSAPHSFVVMNGVLYFSADNGVHGRELWKTDGTASGTQLVRDINPSGDSFPGSFAVSGTTLFFVADNGSAGWELWKTDGTTDGTRLVKDINPSGNGLANLAELEMFDGKVYFGGNTSASGTELWVSDGTSAGTVQVKNINPNGSSSPSWLRVCNGQLFFRAQGNTGEWELWKTNGTSAGTQLVKAIPATYLTVVGTTLFFVGENATYGTELWKSDGTSAGTVLVRNINPAGGSHPYGLRAFQNQVYFGANDGTGIAFWKSNGTAFGTQRVISVEPERITVIGNYLYFAAGRLWRSDGTSAGTKEMGVGYDYTNPHFMMGYGNLVLFAANDQQGVSGTDNYELHKLAPCYACPVGQVRQGTEPELAAEMALTVLKNPTPDEITVEVRGAGGKPLSLQLTNLQGQLIESRTIPEPLTTERQRFDVRQLPPGLLLLRAISADQTQTVRIGKSE